MKRQGIFLLLTVCCFSICAGPSRAAQLELDSKAPYDCAAVNGGDTKSGTPVIAYSCAGSFGQEWNYVNGQLEGIGTANGKTNCLDIKGNSEVSGTLVQIFPCNGGMNQQWVITPLLEGPNTGHIEVLGFGGLQGVCLDSSGGPPVGGGTQLLSNTCNGGAGGASQFWIVRRMELELNASAPPHLCAAVKASKIASGTPVVAYSCSGAFNDEWNYFRGKILSLGTVNGTAMCLTGPDRSSDAGFAVTISTCDGSDGQLWRITTTSRTPPAGNIELLATGTGLCLDAAAGSGAQLVANGCSGAASQNWNAR